MNTYQLQYKNKDGNYIQLLSDDGWPIEFLSKSAAISIAKDLSNLETYPTFGWMVCNSTGEKTFLS